MTGDVRCVNICVNVCARDLCRVCMRKATKKRKRTDSELHVPPHKTVEPAEDTFRPHQC